MSYELFPLSYWEQGRVASQELLVTLLWENCRNGIFITQNVPDVLCFLFADVVAECADTAIALQRQLEGSEVAQWKYD